MPDLALSFLALPAGQLADAALTRARELGAEHADFRLERIRTGVLQLRDAKLDSSTDTQDLGLAVRVIHNGAWGFAGDIARTPDAARRLAERAVATAKVSRVHVDRGGGKFYSMRTLAGPTGRGWEYVTGTAWDFDAEIAELPEQLAEHVKAPSVEAGNYDLVIDPSNLWLTIHESIGHATELDRALGYEAAYAGTSFATPDKLGSLKYGSDVMHVIGDRTAEHGLATIGYDDEGVAGQSWDLIARRVLVGYQLDRRMALLNGFRRSNGWPFADSPGHMPLQRAANASLRPPARRPASAR